MALVRVDPTSRAVAPRSTSPRPAAWRTAPAAKAGGWSTLALAGNLVFGLIATFVLGIILSLTVLPRLINYQTYVVLTGSMEPIVPVGTVVIVVPTDPRDLRVGDIISFTRWDMDKEPVTITHRVRKVVNDDAMSPSFETKGDANGAVDSLPVRYLGPAGKVVGWVPYFGYFFIFARTPIGRMLLLTVPALAFAAIWLWGIWKPRPAAVEAPVDPEPATPFAAEVLGRAYALLADPAMKVEQKFVALRRLSDRADRAGDFDLVDRLESLIARIASDEPDLLDLPLHPALPAPEPIQVAPSPVPSQPLAGLGHLIATLKLPEALLRGEPSIVRPRARRRPDGDCAR